MSGFYGVPGWTTTTPAPTATSGTFTTATATVKHMAVGRLMVFWISVAITNAGTAAGNIFVELPRSVVNGQAGGGKEIQGTGLQCNWQISAATTIAIAKYDNTTIIGAPRTVVVSGTLELA
jgi:hypothetical protein